jgi:hypothetical protein
MCVLNGKHCSQRLNEFLLRIVTRMVQATPMPSKPVDASVWQNACYEGDLVTVRRLLDQDGGAVFVARRDEVQWVAHCESHTLHISLQDCRRPLHWACSGGQSEIVSLLVEECNADVNAADEVPCNTIEHEVWTR